MTCVEAREAYVDFALACSVSSIFHPSARRSCVAATSGSSTGFRRKNIIFFISSGRRDCLRLDSVSAKTGKSRSERQLRLLILPVKYVRHASTQRKSGSIMDVAVCVKLRRCCIAPPADKGKTPTDYSMMHFVFPHLILHPFFDIDLCGDPDRRSCLGLLLTLNVSTLESHRRVRVLRCCA